MEEKPAFEILIERVEAYFKTTTELIRLRMIDKTSDAASHLFSGIILLCVFSICILVLNIGIAFWIGDLTGKTHYGFLIVGGFYLLLGIILFRFRKSILETGIKNAVITRLLNKSGE